MNCIYCRNLILNFQQINGERNHTDCGRECVRREGMRSCVFCDKHKVAGDNRGCDSCIANNADYQGYVGPPS